MNNFETMSSTHRVVNILQRLAMSLAHYIVLSTEISRSKEEMNGRTEIIKAALWSIAFNRFYGIAVERQSFFCV